MSVCFFVCLNSVYGASRVSDSAERADGPGQLCWRRLQSRGVHELFFNDVFLYTMHMLIPRFSPYQPSLPRSSSCWRQRNQSAQLVRMTFFNESKHVLSQEFFFYSNIWNLFLMTLIHLVELFRNHLFYFIIFSSVPWRWRCQSNDQWISEEFMYYGKQKTCS